MTGDMDRRGFFAALGLGALAPMLGRGEGRTTPLAPEPEDAAWALPSGYSVAYTESAGSSGDFVWLGQNGWVYTQGSSNDSVPLGVVTCTYTDGTVAVRPFE